jgi:hypothetical protein
MRRFFAFVILALSLSGCAQSLQAKLQQVDVSVYGTLKAIDAYENNLYVNQTMCGDRLCADKAAHTKFSNDFLIAVQAGKTFHVSLMAWKPGQPIPVDVVDVSAGLKAAAETLKTAFAEGPGKATLAALIDAGALAVNQALVLILPQQEADGLMPPALLHHGN